MKARVVSLRDIARHGFTLSPRVLIAWAEAEEELLTLLQIRIWALEHGYARAGEARRCPRCGSSNLREYFPGEDYDPGLAHDYDGQCNWCGREYLDSEVWVEDPPAEIGAT